MAAVEPGLGTFGGVGGGIGGRANNELDVLLQDLSNARYLLPLYFALKKGDLIITCTVLLPYVYTLRTKWVPYRCNVRILARVS